MDENYQQSMPPHFLLLFHFFMYIVQDFFPSSCLWSPIPSYSPHISPSFSDSKQMEIQCDKMPQVKQSDTSMPSWCSLRGRKRQNFMFFHSFFLSCLWIVPVLVGDMILCSVGTHLWCSEDSLSKQYSHAILSEEGHHCFVLLARIAVQ